MIGHAVTRIGICISCHRSLHDWRISMRIHLKVGRQGDWTWFGSWAFSHGTLGVAVREILMVQGSGDIQSSSWIEFQQTIQQRDCTGIIDMKRLSETLGYGQS